MIDGETFALARPSHQVYLSVLEKKFLTANGDHLSLKDDEYLICHFLMPGFSLSDKL